MKKLLLLTLIFHTTNPKKLTESQSSPNLQKVHPPQGRVLRRASLKVEQEQTLKQFKAAALLMDLEATKRRLTREQRNIAIKMEENNLGKESAGLLEKFRLWLKGRQLQGRKSSVDKEIEKNTDERDRVARAALQENKPTNN